VTDRVEARDRTKVEGCAALEARDVDHLVLGPPNERDVLDALADLVLVDGAVDRR
jgi:hypothetical protein